MNIRMKPRQSIAVLGISVALLATACGTGKNASAEVASLGSTTGTGAETATTAPVDTQDALLQYAACMRENGVDMADPTFDADGNPTGGGFGPGSGIDPQSTDFQTAQTACGDLLQGVQFGGRGRNGIDREAIQNSLNDFTACLRDDGLEVDDITFGPPGGAAGANNGATTGSIPAGATDQGGGFGGPPPDGSAPPNGAAGGPGGAGFDPTARMIERLGLDDTDPAVAAALAKCEPLMTAAFQPPTSTTTATTP
ncbi:MAG: hypothetical protein ABI862_07575 [Ilumatobacteraceae bacterium]